MRSPTSNGGNVIDTPPTYQEETEERYSGESHPFVDKDGWCGEYKRKEYK